MFWHPSSQRHSSLFLIHIIVRRDFVEIILEEIIPEEIILEEIILEEGGLENEC